MEKTNVVIILADELKATALQLYGNKDCPTPAIESLAERGVLFENAITPCPLCVPARVSMMTGRFPHSHGSRRNETLLAPNRENAFRLWKDKGYSTGLIGKNHCFLDDDRLNLFDVWCEIEHYGFVDGHENIGMDWWRSPDDVVQAHSVRRNMPWQTPNISCAVTEFPIDDYSTGLIAGQAERFIDRYADDPFALWVSFPDPHEPFEAPREYVDLFDPDSLSLPDMYPFDKLDGGPVQNRVLREILDIASDDESDIRRLLSVYYAMIRFIDDGVKRILDALDRHGLREKTIVTFVADHGDFAGEHGMVRKGGCFYDALARIPMVFSCPGRIPEGVVETGMASLVDVWPTLLSLQGIEIPDGLQGAPLPPVSEGTRRGFAFTEYGAGGPNFTLDDLQRQETPTGDRALMQSLQTREAEGRRKMVRSERWKLVYDPDSPAYELYDLQKDPHELRNLYGESEYGDVVNELMRELLNWSIRTEDAEPVPLPDA